MTFRSHIGPSSFAHLDHSLRMMRRAVDDTQVQRGAHVAHVAQFAKMHPTPQVSEYGLRRPSLPSTRAPNAMLLISDVDGTLTGDDLALKTFKLHWLEEQLPRGSILCYNTARSAKCFVDGLRLKNLPDLLQPDVLITADGTEIMFFDSEGIPHLCRQWDRQIREHWNLERVAAVMDAWDAGCIPGINDGEDLRRSITVAPANRVVAAVAIRDALGEHVEVNDIDSWVSDVVLITALPKAAGKGNAAMALRGMCNFPLSQTMWAGDTKGDASFLRTDIQGVVVRNASQEFLMMAANHPGCALLACGRSAFGVLEGMNNYGMC